MKRTFLPPAHPLYQVQFRGLRSDALPVFEQQLLPACVEEANNPAHVPPGELRKIEGLDEYGKVRFIDWIGQEHFTKPWADPADVSLASAPTKVASTRQVGHYDEFPGPVDHAPHRAQLPPDQLPLSLGPGAFLVCSVRMTATRTR